MKTIEFRAAAFLSLLVCASHAQSTNPDLSALGQVVLQSGDHAGWGAPGATRLQSGEAEVVLDAPLNPYAHGAFVFSFSRDGASMEEGWASIDNGLPLGLAVKAGQFRQPFGALNPVHTHAYAFIDAPRLLDPKASGYLPGDESFNDVGLEASTLLPLGPFAFTLEGGALGGDPFRDSTDTIGQQLSRLGWIARGSLSGDFGEGHAFAIGVSGTGGTQDTRTGSRVALLGADARVKLRMGPEERLVLATEGIARFADSSSNGSANTRLGAYGYADYQLGRWDAGALLDVEQELSGGGSLDRTLAMFAGFKLFEETTLFRVKLERTMLASNDPDDAIKVQILYSMGPHKPHSF